MGFQKCVVFGILVKIDRHVLLANKVTTSDFRVRMIFLAAAMST